jgi:hypothetical protein
MTTPIDAKAIRSSLTNDGFIVFPKAVPVADCHAVLNAIGNDLGI